MSSTSTTWTTDTNTKSGVVQIYESNVSVLKILGIEGGNSILELFADQGDDNADKWRMWVNASDDDLHFANYTSGAWADLLTIQDGGNVGIGTSSPGGKLHIVEGTATGQSPSTNVDTLVLDSTNNVMGISMLGAVDKKQAINFGDTGDADIGRIEYDHDGDKMLFHTNAAQRMTILSSGNVGIGTASPSLTTHIRGAKTAQSTTVVGQLLIEDTTAYNASPRAGIIFGGITTSGGTYNTLGSIQVGKLNTTDGNESSTMSFNTRLEGANPATAMLIDENGRIGIGQATPQSDNSTARFLHIGDSGDASAGLVLEDNDNQWEILTNNNLYFLDGTDTRLFIAHTTGSVGIGTTSPDGNLEIAKTGGDCVVRITTYDDDATDVSQLILQTADNTEASPQLIDDNDLLGVIKFRGYTNAFNDGAWIQARAAATPASGSDMPADLEFATSADGSASPSTRMVILSDGKIGIGTATPYSLLTANLSALGVPINDFSVLQTRSAITVSAGAVTDTMLMMGLGSGSYAWMQCINVDDSLKNLALNPSGGRVGIGTTDPNCLLELDQGATDIEIFQVVSSDVAHGMTDIIETDVYGSFMKFQGDSGGLRIRGWKDADDSNYGALYLEGNLGETANSTKSASGYGVIHLDARVKTSATTTAVGSDGNLVTIGSNTVTKFAFDQEGQMHATIASTTFSDGRLKTEQAEVPYGLAEVLQLQPKAYKKHQPMFNEDGSVKLDGETRDEIGFVAQEVKALIPELVRDIDEGDSFYGLNDGKLMAVVIKAIQELSAKVTALESA